MSIRTRIVKAAAALTLSAAAVGIVTISPASAAAGDPSQWGRAKAEASVAGDPSQWGSRKVNEYEGQHRKVSVEKVNEYEHDGKN
jgi:hypothetical protein